LWGDRREGVALRPLRDRLFRRGASVLERRGGGVTNRAPPRAMRADQKARSPEKTGTECAGPWETVTHCRTGCAAEGLEVTGAKSDANGFQLCRPEQPFARPVLGSDDASVDVCSEASTTCRDGIVRMCSGVGQVARNVAYCIFGCAPGLNVDDEGDGPTANPDGPTAILCRRSDAERR